MRIKGLPILLWVIIVVVAYSLRAWCQCIKGDCRESYGTFIYSDQSKYSGDWKEGLRHGKGIYSYSNGSIYSGQWENDEFSGYGALTYPDDTIYEGQWKNSLRNGQGTYTSISGSKYTGQWKNDKLHGQASYLYPGGYIFVGEWVNGIKSGIGSYSYPDGSTFIGQWKEDRQFEDGTFTDKTGAKYVGKIDTDGKLYIFKKLSIKPQRTAPDDSIEKASAEEVAAAKKAAAEEIAAAKKAAAEEVAAAKKAAAEEIAAAKKAATEEVAITAAENKKTEDEKAAGVDASKEKPLVQKTPIKKPFHKTGKTTFEMVQGKIFSDPYGFKFVYIPPGFFKMGSPQNEKGRYDNEIQHEVIFEKGFFMQLTEVTQKQWSDLMGDNPSFFRNCGDDCPVEQVSWNDIKQLVWRLNQLEGAYRYRLPTEAEWEYACRAGKTTALNNGEIQKLKCDLDPGLNAVAWFCGNSDHKTHQAAQKQANAWGLFDMHGNVSELCLDWYGEYPPTLMTDPPGPASGLDRVARGGGWDSESRHCRSACRGAASPNDKFSSLGFRLIRMP